MTLDLRTLIVVLTLVSGLAALVFGLGARQSVHPRALRLAAAGEAVVAGGLALIALEGMAPDTVAILGGNAVLGGGAVLLLLGIYRLTGHKPPLLPTLAVYAAYLAGFVVFTLIWPDTGMRVVVQSLVLGPAALLTARLVAAHRPNERAHAFSAAMLGAAGVILVLRAADVVIRGAPLGPLGANATQTAMVLVVTVLHIGWVLGVPWMLQVHLRDRVESGRDALAETAAALEHSRNRFRIIFEKASVGFAFTDATGRLLETNAAFAAMVGATDPTALVGVDFEAITHPDDLAVERRMVADIAAGRIDRYRFEKRYRRLADGNTVWADVLVTALRTGDGQPVNLVAVAMDISARHAAENALLHERAQLQRSNAELEQFAYVASHDLREPLRMINSFLTVLERRLASRLAKEEEEFLQFARDGAVRMDALILDLLEYSRIGRGPCEDGPVALGDVVRDARMMLAAASDDVGGRIEVAEATLPVVRGRRTDLTRLFVNLIGNALKYHAPDRPPVVRVSAQAQPGGWRIMVADNGIGIAAEHNERIFGLFQRLQTRQSYEGTGIGLAVCRKVAESMGGHIEVTSREGEGSTFTIHLPASAILDAATPPFTHR